MDSEIKIYINQKNAMSALSDHNVFGMRTDKHDICLYGLLQHYIAITRLPCVSLAGP